MTTATIHFRSPQDNAGSREALHSGHLVICIRGRSYWEAKPLAPGVPVGGHSLPTHLHVARWTPGLLHLYVMVTEDALNSVHSVARSCSQGGGGGALPDSGSALFIQSFICKQTSRTFMAKCLMHTLFLEGPPHWFPQWLHQFAHPLTLKEGSPFPHIPASTCYLWPL